MKKYINHMTMNTGSLMKIEPDSVDKELLFYLKNIVKDAKSESGAEIFDKYKFKLTMEDEDFYVGTLFLKMSDMEIPILSTFGTNNNKKRITLWGYAQDLYRNFYKDNVEVFPQSSPIIVDVLFPTLNVDLFDVYEWSGDFTKCIGYILLFEIQDITKND